MAMMILGDMLGAKRRRVVKAGGGGWRSKDEMHGCVSEANGVARDGVPNIFI